ncbi:MAG TPA: aldo/keto reductase [Ktedonobacteraceae bacterium]
MLHQSLAFSLVAISFIHGDFLSCSSFTHLGRFAESSNHSRQSSYHSGLQQVYTIHSPLGRGYLTGMINEHTTFDSSDLRSRNPRFTPEAIKANQMVIDLLARIGAQKQATPAQVALAWLLAQKPWIVPIPGSRKIERLEENIGAVQVELTESDRQEIGNVMSTITVLGDRY